MIPRMQIGPAGWSYPDWRGIVYPERTGAKFDPLVYLATYFNLIEINSTFYRIPSVQTARSWARRVSAIDGFRFTSKLFREFTHSATPPSRSEVDLYKDAVAPLYEAGRLGAVLVQFPWSFKFTTAARNRIVDLAAWLDPIPSFVEVRHGGWGTKTASSFFADHGIGLCGIDQPLIGNSLRPDRFAAGKAGMYFRLHGRNHANWFNERADRDARYDYLYTTEEIGAIAGRIEQATRDVETVFVVTNNHFRGQAVANALEISAAITRRKPLAPRGLVRAFPRIEPIVEPDTPAPPRERRDGPQMSLFDDEKND